MSLLPGTYEFGWNASSGCSEPDGPQGVPCVSGSLAGQLNLTSAGSLELDLPLVNLSGALTVNGQQAPVVSGGASRGAIYFVQPDGAQGQVELLESAGGLSYQIEVFPGDYQLQFAGNSSFCAHDSGVSLPCGTAIIEGCEGFPAR